MTAINTASARSILLSLGVGDYNATTIIPMLFYGPAQTDPQLTQSVLLVKHMQRMMQSMGAKAVVTGTIDSTWEPYFIAIAGPQWTSVPWFDIARSLLEFKDRGQRFKLNYDGGRQIDLSGDSLLPDLPGGMITYAALAAGAFLLLKKKR